MLPRDYLGTSSWVARAVPGKQNRNLLPPIFLLAGTIQGKKGTPDGGEWVETSLASGELGEREHFS